MTDLLDLLSQAAPPMEPPPDGLNQAVQRARTMRRRAAALRMLAVPLAALVVFAAVTTVRESSRVELTPADVEGPPTIGPTPSGAERTDGDAARRPGSAKQKPAAAAPADGAAPLLPGRGDSGPPAGPVASNGQLLYRNRDRLFVQPLRDGEPRLVVETPHWIFGWAADGKHLLMANGDPDPETGTEIYLLDVATASHRPLLRHEGFTIYSAAMSQDGRKIVYSASEFHGDLVPEAPPPQSEGERLFVADADGRNIRALGINGSRPAWSPDGRSIVFTCSHGGSWACTARADGTGVRGIGYIMGPMSWSPDGQWIAGYGASGLTLYRPDGSGERPLGVRSHMDLPQWTPDGKRMVYHRAVQKSTPTGCDHPPCDQPPGIFAVAVDGSGVETRLTTSENDSYPLVSMR